MDPAQVEERIKFALMASEYAQRLVLKYFLDASLQVDFKADHSPVTAADRGAEEILRKEIGQAYPDDALLGEEFGEKTGTSGYRWVLDPVDGTKSFVYGVPLYGMLIGLQSAGECVGGICRIPGLDEVVFAWKEGGTWWQRGADEPVRARVRETTSLSESLLCFTALEGFLQIDRTDLLEKFAKQSRLSRGWGDCYGHLLVATGRADVMVDPLLAEWDAAALIPIVEEAGGVFMDWQGTSTPRGGNGISTTPALKHQVLELIKEHRP